MKRAARLDALPLSIDYVARTPMWSQISTGFRVAIANGFLRPGMRVPSTRALARQLRVSRNTAMAAYDDLTARGLMTACTGSGSFVTAAARASAPVDIWFFDSSGNSLALAPLD